MEDLTALLGAPRTAKIGDKEWTFSPVTLGDLGTVTDAARVKFNREKKEEAKLLKDTMSGMQAPAIAMWEAIERVLTRKRGILDGLDGPDEAAQIVMMSLQKHHTDVTSDDVAAMLTVRSVTPILALCGLEKDDKGDGDSKND